MKNIVCFGGGNHVSPCIDAIQKQGIYNIVGIIDSEKEIGIEVSGYNIIGRQEDLMSLIEEYKIDAGVITVGDNWSRKTIYDSVINQCNDFQFGNVIHPTAVIGKNVEIGFGVVILSLCVIDVNCKIGNFTLFINGAIILHDCQIDEFASISAGATLGGRVSVGKFSAIALGTTVVDRITIGENTVIGSGSLVMKSLPDNVLAYGSPAKIIRDRQLGERFLS